MKLTNTEIRFMSLIWHNEPIQSGELVSLCANEFYWKKSTTYTFLKRLQERGLLQNNHALVTSIVKEDEVQKIESEFIIKNTFSGSLPKFVTSYLSDRKLSKTELEELKNLLDNFKE